MAIDNDALENVGQVHARAERRRWWMINGGEGGVVDEAHLNPTQRAAGVNRSVDVAPGGVFIQGAAAAPHHNGLYPLWSTAVVNVPLAVASPSNPRLDIIVAAVTDTEMGDAGNAMLIGAVTGTAAPSPVQPATPTRAYLIGRVAVAAGATTITDANIVDFRAQCGVTRRAKGLIAFAGGLSLGLVPTGGTYSTITGSSMLTAPGAQRSVRVGCEVTVDGYTLQHERYALRCQRNGIDIGSTMVSGPIPSDAASMTISAWCFDVPGAGAAVYTWTIRQFGSGATLVAGGTCYVEDVGGRQTLI